MGISDSKEQGGIGLQGLQYNWLGRLVDNFLRYLEPFRGTNLG